MPINSKKKYSILNMRSHSYLKKKKISNAPKVRKPSCEHVDGQCGLDFLPTNLNINRLPPLTIWHVCTKFHLHCRSDISFLRYRAEMKIVLNFCSIFRSCDLDLCPTNLIINRLPPLTIRHMCAKFHLDPTFCS